MDAPARTEVTERPSGMNMVTSASVEGLAMNEAKGEYEHLRPQTTDRGWNDPPSKLFSGVPNTGAAGKKVLAAKRKNMRAIHPTGMGQPSSGASSPYGGTPAMGSPASVHSVVGGTSTFTPTANSTTGTPALYHGPGMQAHPYQAGMPESPGQFTQPLAAAGGVPGPGYTVCSLDTTAQPAASNWPQTR